MEYAISHYLPTLATFWQVSEVELRRYHSDLANDQAFLSDINKKIHPVPEFFGKQFINVDEMRTYRCLLYLAARVAQPDVFIETGVQNGMSSAFILLALKHNKNGNLYSVDLPPLDQRILNQGTNPLPRDKTPGWIIPDGLRDRHQLLLGPAEELLPQLLARLKSVDVFLHDSDHSYAHMMFEIGLAWRYLRKSGFIIVDNIEQNESFTDFARGQNARSAIISSFDGADRVWRHGLIAKALT